jgi:hypothetical protein
MYRESRFEIGAKFVSCGSAARYLGSGMLGRQLAMRADVPPSKAMRHTFWLGERPVKTDPPLRRIADCIADHPVAAIRTIYPQQHDLPMDVVVAGAGRVLRRETGR